ARYQSPWAIIDPADSTSFLRGAVIGAIVFLVFAAITRRQPSFVGAAAWLGFLVIVFGVKSWIRHRWPATALWQPRDRDRANRLGTAVIVPLAALCILLYAAPVWVLDHISGGRIETAWAAYTADFVQLKLPLFIGLMVALLANLSFVAL